MASSTSSSSSSSSMRVFYSSCLLLAALALAFGSVEVTAFAWSSGWSSLVTGSVFCDQCLKQAVFPFGLPLKGAQVTVQCYDATGTVVASGGAKTDFIGGYAVTFKGVSDLTGCKAFATSSPDSGCALTESSGGQAVALKTKFFHNAFYAAEPLFFKPPQPKKFCPGQPHPQPPPFSFPPFPPLPHAPPFNFPPFPPINIPPFPWKKPSTCGSDAWLNSDFFCRWKNATPFDTTVGQMFGKAAQNKYGNMSIYTALQQSGDNLLRQAVTAMMNSNTNAHFYMSPKKVRKQFVQALQGADQLKSETAWSFQQANSGFGNGTCMLSSCT